jgi:hypothetical protein
MPKGRRQSNDIGSLISQFAGELTRLIEAEATGRARDLVVSALGGAGSGAGNGRRRGRPPQIASVAVSAGRKSRRKGPPQLCPVPGCKNKAAPVFGMVCKDHKDVAKSKIKQYREDRRAKKAA